MHPLIILKDYDYQIASDIIYHMHIKLFKFYSKSKNSKLSDVVGGYNCYSKQ